MTELHTTNDNPIVFASSVIGCCNTKFQFSLPIFTRDTLSPPLLREQGLAASRRGMLVMLPQFE